MTEGLGLQKAGRYIIWRTFEPGFQVSERSPCFLFQDMECYFEIFRVTDPESESGMHCAIYLRNNGVHKMTFDFEVTSYIESHDGKPIEILKRTVTGEQIRTIYDIDDCLPNYNCRTKNILEFVFLFYGDVGRTLQLNEKKECLCLIDSHKCLSRDMSKLLTEGLNYDIELKCGGRTFKAHRDILSARSQVFQGMLQNDMMEARTGLVEIQDMEPDILQEFMKYLYTAELPEISTDNAVSFYKAGNKYMMEELVRFSGNFLLENLKEEDAFQILILADAYSDNQLKEATIAYFLKWKIPLRHDLWKSFCDSHPKLAIEVLNRSYQLQNENIGSRPGSSFYGEAQDTVFVSGLPESVNEEQLSSYFGSIGVIKIDKKTGKPRIWIYQNKITGEGKGEATITYDDPPTAGAAITWFNEKDFHGKKIKVQLAQRMIKRSFDGGPKDRDLGGAIAYKPRQSGQIKKIPTDRRQKPY